VAAGAGHRGRAALASKGAGGARCRLSAVQLAELEAVPDAGPAVSGRDEDQRSTLARIAEIIWQRFGVEYTLAGADLLLRRIGWTVQVPARQAAERDEARIAAWREGRSPVVKGPRGPGRLADLRGRARPGLTSPPKDGPGAGAAARRW
jgi:transposase